MLDASSVVPPIISLLITMVQQFKLNRSFSNRHFFSSPVGTYQHKTNIDEKFLNVSERRLLAVQ